MKILVTGGLGYIGSHIANLLGKKAIILDNMSNSSLDYKKYLPKATVYVNNLNKKNLNKIFSKHKIQGVIHLASLKSVSESVKNPLNYYKSNVITSLDLIEKMNEYGVNKLIFSSSATVYSNLNKCPFNESMDLKANNPYGSTKIVIEDLITNIAISKKNFSAISLRYFNPLGADHKAGLSERPNGNPQNLVPSIIEAVKKNKIFKVYGNQYSTNDGTCLRDYIHVKDIAAAHLLAFKKLTSFKGHLPINVGLGKGISVLELIKIYEKTNKVKIDFKITKPRKGDVDSSFADISKVKNFLRWKPKYGYAKMVRDAWKVNDF